MAQWVKNPPATQETQVPPRGQEEALQEEMTTHPNIPDWKSPWTEEPGGLQFTGLQRAGFN